MDARLLCLPFSVLHVIPLRSLHSALQDSCPLPPTPLLQGTQFLSSLLSFLRISSRESAQQLLLECLSVKLDSGRGIFPHPLDLG